ncbi:hypothetical protein H6P81_015653 [Aristolochia fimbriata]|uniref:ubiquitinyl hydrolase 1 n=1 Tax=Aristolochia fimbriata TaxID=158543 RepID=A0AAV7E6M8_ARIFI|nr:hypothetical protein H6P81_015653 [Aristolochia fimbriata]
MVDQEEEDLQMALRMSLQPSPPEPKRSKPRETFGDSSEESPEAKNRRLKRELMAAAAEKRMMISKSVSTKATDNKETPVSPKVVTQKTEAARSGHERKEANLGQELSPSDAEQLFLMVFGTGVSKDILAQWCNQGIRFSSDPETCMGLVQHEGGPCGVLATIQAFVLKYLIFCPEESEKSISSMSSQNLALRRISHNAVLKSGDFSSLTEDGKLRALVLSMLEILFLCGSNKRAVIATFGALSNPSFDGSQDGQKDEIIIKALEGLQIESPSDLQKVLRINVHTPGAGAFDHLKAMLPIFQSRLGALLFLISALLSRGLESVQADRDDPSLPLVTAPFGHASQEIVNLLLCGRAVPNVFDGCMDLGGGMSLKGIPTNVEVGFLSLLESLNFCKVGQLLKCPWWPIWVVGSESHYSVLFALDISVQDENELEQRESLVRRAFDAQDQSGGGGFISVEGLHQVLREAKINLPAEKLESLCSSGFIVWSEFWQVLLELDRSLGGLKDSTGLMGKKQFDLYHFNGIAKSVVSGSAGGESPLQRPRLTKLRVSVPPKWTPEDFMKDVSCSSGSNPSGKDGVVEVNQPERSQHAPLVDCIRTRWGRALCTWDGDPPSIV